MKEDKNKNNLRFKTAPLKTQWLLSGGVLVLGTTIAWIFIGVLAAQAKDAFYLNETKKQSLVNQSTAENISSTKARLIDGRIVAKEDANLLPIGVMIENLLSVRPQSGLSSAQVVYETLAEGFSTRFLAVFDPQELPDTIGPVRSSRPYYLEWISEYDGLYVHAGGSPESLAAISGLGIRDLNALYKGQYFWRNRNQSAPHNLYSSKELLIKALRDLGYEETIADFPSWLYSDDSSIDKRPLEAKKVIIKFSGFTYQAEYQYDRESDEYLRFNAGLPHLDKNTGKQLKAKNVIAIQIPPVSAIGEKGRLTLDIVGEGRALVARHGEVIESRWKKPDRLARTRFYDQTGKEIELGRGATWIHILPEPEEFLAE